MPKRTLWRSIHILVTLLVVCSMIGPRAAYASTDLKLCRDHETENSPFQVSNLFPGDCEEQTYHLQVSCKGTVTIHFHAYIGEGSQKLADVIKCRVSVENGAPLYDGLMKDMPEHISHTLVQDSIGTADLIYQVSVYLDTDVTSEYMAQEFSADFCWWTETEEGQGEMTTPKTGDLTPLHIWLWIAAVSAAVILVLFRKNVFSKNRRSEAHTYER